MLLQKFKATVANFFANICKRFFSTGCKVVVEQPAAERAAAFRFLRRRAA
jgi:hypothetical protein